MPRVDRGLRGPVAVVSARRDRAQQLASLQRQARAALDAIAHHEEELRRLRNFTNATEQAIADIRLAELDDTRPSEAPLVGAFAVWDRDIEGTTP